VWKVSQSSASKSNPSTGLNRPRGLREVGASRFHDNLYIKVARLLAFTTTTTPPSPQEIFLVLILARSCVVLRAIEKIPMTPCSIVPQPTALPRAPNKWKQWHKTNEVIKHTKAKLRDFWWKRWESKVPNVHCVRSAHLQLISKEDTFLWQTKRFENTKQVK